MNNTNIPSGFINTNTSSLNGTTNNNNNGFTGIHSNVLKSLSNNKNPLNSFMNNTNVSVANNINKPIDKQQNGNFNETSSVPLSNYYSMNNQFPNFHNGSNGVVSNGSMNNQQPGYHYSSFQPYNNNNTKKYRNNDHLLDQSLSYQIDFNDQYTDNQSYGNNYYQNVSNQPPQQPLDHNFGNNFFLNNSAPMFGSSFGGDYQNKQPLTTNMGPILGNQPSRQYQPFNYPNNSYNLNNLTNVINNGNQTAVSQPPLHYNNSNYQYYVNSDNQYPAASTSTTSYSTPRSTTASFEGSLHQSVGENFNQFQDPNSSNSSQFRFEVNNQDIIQPPPTATANDTNSNTVTDTSSNNSSTANGSGVTTSNKNKPQKSKKKEKKKTTPLLLKPIEIIVLQELLSSDLDTIMKDLKVTYTFDNQGDRLILEFKKVTFEKVEQQVRDLLKKVFFRECYCEMKEERRREIQKKASKYNSLCFFDSANVCHVASLSEDDMEKLSKHIYCFIGVYKLHEKESIETILKHNYKYQIKPQKDKHNNQIENEIALYCHCPSEKAKAKLEKKIAKRGDSPSIKIKLIRKCHPELLNPTDYSERDNKVVLKDSSDSKELKKWLDRIEIIHIHDITGRTELFGETKKELENYLDSYNRMAYQITRDIDKKKKVYVDIAIISDEFDTNTKNVLKQKTIEIIRGYKKMIPSDSLPVDVVQNLTRYITTMKLPIGVYIDHSDQTKMFYIRGVRMEKVEEAFRTFDVEMKKYLEKTVQISFTNGTEREMGLPILLKKVSKTSSLRLTKGTSDLSYSLTGPIKECEQFMKNEYADIIGQVKQSILYMNNNNFNFL